MKARILFFAIILLSAASAHSQQKLKDLLYGGKLKLDTGTVIRKDDDLSTKIDTSTKKPPVEPEKKAAVLVVDPVSGNVTTQQPVVVDSVTTAGATATGPKDNNKVWKDYMDELIGALRTEVVPSKKLKDGTYSVLIDYEIGTDGQITVNSVSTSPESSFLEQQVKERITLTAPQLTPLLGTNGKPRKAMRKQTITIAK